MDTIIEHHEISPTPVDIQAEIPITIQYADQEATITNCQYPEYRPGDRDRRRLIIRICGCIRIELSAI